MAYRRVDTRIWLDARFRSLGDDPKLAFLFVLTNPDLTTIGALRGRISAWAEDLGWERDRLARAVQELEFSGMVTLEPEAGFLWLPKFLRYNPAENPNQVRNWKHALDRIPECETKTVLIESLEQSLKTRPETFQTAFASVLSGLLHNPLPNGSPNRSGNPSGNRPGNPMPKREREREREREQEREREEEGRLLRSYVSEWRKSGKTRGNPDPESRNLRDRWFEVFDSEPGVCRDPAAFAAALSRASFAHNRSWFTFRWLLSTDRSGNRNLSKLMEGAYEDDRSKTDRRNGPGQRHDPAATGGGDF